MCSPAISNDNKEIPQTRPAPKSRRRLGVPLAQSRRHRMGASRFERWRKQLGKGSRVEEPHQGWRYGREVRSTPVTCSPGPCTARYSANRIMLQPERSPSGPMKMPRKDARRLGATSNSSDIENPFYKSVLPCLSAIRPKGDSERLLKISSPQFLVCRWVQAASGART
jgi:hypothetical protein